MDSNSTLINQSDDSFNATISPTSDRTGLFIALFLLSLLFILIFYLFYSFFTFKRFSSRQTTLDNNLLETNHNNKIIFDDSEDLINNNGEIIVARNSSFSDCGTSLRSSSIHSHFPSRGKRSSSYKLCSQASNYLLTPRLSSQIGANTDENMSTTIIVEPNDVHLASALSRSISKYYERKRKPKLKRRTHSCEELMIQNENSTNRSLQVTASLPMRHSLKLPDRNNRQRASQTSFRRKPTTIYELYKSDRMRIANLLVSDP